MRATILNLDSIEASRSVYRIISFVRLCEFFESGKMTLVRPEKWDDPFENYLSGAVYKQGQATVELGVRRSVYGSCWTLRAASDAMWRIYSPDKTAIRIKTRPRLLAKALDEALARKASASAFVGKVQYLSEREIVARARTHAMRLYKESSPTTVAESYLYKRNPFSHEAEVRVLVIDRNARPAAGGLLQLTVNPHDLVESVLVDPRAPASMVQMYKGHLTAAYGFKRHVGRSTIYNNPKPLVIQLPAS